MKKKSGGAPVSVKVSEKDYRRLQAIAFGARRSGGAKLSAAVVVRALVRLLMLLDVDLSAVRSEAELRRRLRKAKVREGI